MTYFGQRESLTYGLLASSGLLLLLLAGVTWHYMLPIAPRLQLAHTGEFVGNQPQLHHLGSTLNGSSLNVYVVKLADQFYAWDSVPAVPQPCARIQWNAEFNRFEDPCSGAKWCADGTIADGRVPQTRTLTCYPVEISQDGAIYLLPEHKQLGEAAPAIWRETHAIDWMPPAELYTCQHLPAF